MEGGQYKIGAIIQARLGSKRLPNKVIMPIGNTGRTIISQIIYRLNKLKIIDKVVIATSISEINDRLVNYAKELNVDCFRGDEENVLSRFSNIVEKNEFDYVLRFTADNPIIDSIRLEKFIEEVITKKLDYCYSQNLPLGCNFEMIKASLLVEANDRAIIPYDKEHVTPYVKRETNNKSFFKFPKNDLFDRLRLTIDYPSDYSFIYLISGLLNGKELNIDNIESLIRENHWLLKINESNFQKKQYTNISEEILEILPVLKEREMWRIEKKLIDEI